MTIFQYFGTICIINFQYINLFHSVVNSSSFCHPLNLWFNPKEDHQVIGFDIANWLELQLQNRINAEEFNIFCRWAISTYWLDNSMYHTNICKKKKTFWLTKSNCRYLIRTNKPKEKNLLSRIRSNDRLEQISMVNLKWKKRTQREI